MGSVLSSLVLGPVSAGITLAEYKLEPKEFSFLDEPCEGRNFKRALLKSAQIAVTVIYLAAWIPTTYIVPACALSLFVMPSVVKAINAPKPLKTISNYASIISRIACAILPPLVISSTSPVLAGIVFFIVAPAHIYPCFVELKSKWMQPDAI